MAECAISNACGDYVRRRKTTQRSQGRSPVKQEARDFSHVRFTTKGSRDGIDDELRAFLDYLETQTPTDDFTSCLDMNVIKVNGNSKWRENAMTLEMKYREIKKEGIEEGIEQTLVNLVKDKLLAVSEAAKRLGISQDDFMALLNK